MSSAPGTALARGDGPGGMPVLERLEKQAAETRFAQLVAELWDQDRMRRETSADYIREYGAFLEQVRAGKA